ncbi:MAG TPA: hypothetical protein DIU00_04720 [Phycisphaerales bacterium]|nr:hypothetical protein [Phycisphaerales bacterium]
MKHYRCFVFLILISACLARPVFGCAVPVFRYALERWAPDAYEAVLIHRGPLADDDPAAALLKGEDAEFLNLRISTMDLETSAENELTSILGGAVPETLPALAIWYPYQKGRAAPFWTGEFTPATVKALIQSPKRLQLAQRLTDGQTAVWLVVESGNAAKDKAAMQILDEQLATATKELKEMTSELAEELDMPVVSYEFSTLTISRSDPEERMLLEMLLKSEPDLGDYADGPIVFPVFGRGRALYALASEGINADTIRETISFITGPCGCEIKMMNPGVDLLMSVNWDAAAMQFYQEFYEMAEEPLPELTGVFPEEPADAGLNAQSEVVVAAINPGPDSSVTDKDLPEPAQAPEQKVHRFGVMGTTVVSLGTILVVAALGTFAMSRFRK